MVRCGWLLLIALTLSACTTFATVQPARISSGPSFHAQATVAAPPGELPGWIWSFDCAEGCNHSIPGVEIGASIGVSGPTRRFSVGGGVMAPLTPFLEAYWQIAGEPSPSGVGARVGVPVNGWGEYRVFYRRELSSSVITNTHAVVATGSSPNGANTATFVALLQSIGLLERGSTAIAIPAVSIGVSHTTRERHGERETAFGLMAIGSIGI